MILKISKFILIVLLLVFVFGYFSVQIWDPDFWWHLKTGEYIYQTGSLPKTDPFAYTSLPSDPTNEALKKQEFTLTQYWLAELIFYRVYRSFGFQGIIFLRASIFTLIIFLLYKGIRREGIGFYLTIGLLIPVVIILHSFTGERPQLFSFLFSFLLVFLLEGYRRSSLTRDTQTSSLNESQRASGLFYLLPLPFIMLIWANLHGGFILGLLIILGYQFSEIIKYFLKRFGKPLPFEPLKKLTIVCILSIFFSYFNPNGYTVISILLAPQKNLQSTDIIEWFSPLHIILSGYITQELIIYFILFSLSLFLILINIKRSDLTDIAIFIGLTVISQSAARFIPFFTPVATLMVARYGAMTIEKLARMKRLINIKKLSERPLLFLKDPLINIVFCTLLSITVILGLIKGNLFESGVRKGVYPEEAVRFLRENRLSGNMFNPYVWGGYLIWTLHPDYKVFIDGRGLVEEVYLQNKQIGEASTKILIGLPEWKALLKAYKVNFIVTYSVNEFSGTLIPLVPALFNDPEWHLIYMDNNSLIFLRDSPENFEIIKKFGMPKEWLWNEVAVETALKARAHGKNMNFYITMGDAFSAKKSYKDAKAAYLKALEMNPESVMAKERLEFIETTVNSR